MPSHYLQLYHSLATCILSTAADRLPAASDSFAQLVELAKFEWRDHWVVPTMQWATTNDAAILQRTRVELTPLIKGKIRDFSLSILQNTQSAMIDPFIFGQFNYWWLLLCIRKMKLLTDSTLVRNASIISGLSLRPLSSSKLEIK